MPLSTYILLTQLFPLLGALVAGLLGKKLGRTWTHRIVIVLIGLAFLCALYLFNEIVINRHAAVNHLFYTWGTAGIFKFDIGFLLDPLSAAMIMIVLFVSLMVHIYTIGYMADDPGYQRFFSYVSLFTFFMLTLVLANNFLVLFFGWEGVGLVSYLLIGFWFKREAANIGSLKAFLVNRIGDLGFVLGIAAILMYFSTLNYQQVFMQISNHLDDTMQLMPQVEISIITLICLLLFIGAMAKSAQVPLHVWLPESMEGPTPISALIHAATMVTAGIYMVARMSPFFEHSEAMLNFILIIGGTTAFFMGLVAIVQNDIKRVIAYSTLSQLGYMAVALGASAYDIAIFHLVTHAFFKALLFLAAGSVIIALHHEQDMQKMGALARKLPVTYITFLIGSLALCAIPPFAGFYSKDMIIEAVKLSHLPGATYAYYCVLAGAFVTAVYTFRAFFLTFHTQSRVDPKLLSHTHEPGAVVWLPLVLLAIPSALSGQWLVGPMLFANPKLLANSIFILPDHNPLTTLANHYHGAGIMALEAGNHLTLWLSLAGIIIAWLCTAMYPGWSTFLKQRFSLIYTILLKKYGFDDFNEKVFVKGTHQTGHLFYDVSDVKLIDGVFVNGSGRLIQLFARLGKRLQTGYLYHYALSMILGLILFLVWYGGF